MTENSQLGPIICDVAGLTLTDKDRQRIANTNVGGIILFARNFESREQVTELVQDIKSVKSPEVLVMVDHEGGRVQRFTEGFTKIPPMFKLGELYLQDQEKAFDITETIGFVIGMELLSIGIDLSFSPVLDIESAHNSCLNTRCFSRDPAVVSILSEHYIKGQHRAGMSAVGKHFPGHGFVEADSHLELPTDQRPMLQIEANDLKPYKHTIKRELLDAVMTAHILYSNVDQNLATYSSFWLKQILREQCGFQGVIFSDDLNMQAAHIAGSLRDRLDLSLLAGCDFAIICNDLDGTDKLLDDLAQHHLPVAQNKLDALRGKNPNNINRDVLLKSSQWREMIAKLSFLENYSVNEEIHV